MKKQTLLISATLIAALLSGCGAKPQAAPPTQTEPPAQEEPTTPPEAPQNTFAASLPAGVEQLLSETKPLPELAKAIVDEYQIPEEEWAQTKYYYNYVDLNGDGTDEIFAIVMGPYTSGTSGDSALWLLPYAGMAVSQTFTMFRAPIIISDTITNGAHEIVFQRGGGGGKAETIHLICSDGVYNNPSDAEVLENIDDLTGKAIICNDFIADMDSGSYLTLEDAKDAA
ncbi:hypothetical protein [Oscillibacter sp.]|uniref:hypothetical protein n=1 Tax=Oscillibacter sp. TaxID=1945593 RepID=UPI002615506D|nr:hypothetical protein [Oscillibacter sp.]MDD3347663.1 hypothetical protein [Oscillibacter sp.]